VLDRETGEIRYPSERIMCRVGYHTLDWCGADPDRRINENIRPVAEPLVGGKENKII